MTIYIDSDYKCHVSPGNGLTAVETDAFDGKCRRYVEGYRFVPAGQSWTRADGQVFRGEMIAPAQDYTGLVMAQEGCDEAQETAAAEMAALVEEVYNSDREVIDNV